MGVVHHANYFNYFELGRTELLRAQGGNYRQMEERGLHLVVVKLACTFRAPAHYDDLLTLRTITTHLGHAKLEHDYELFHEGDLLANAHSVLACVGSDGRILRIRSFLPAHAN